jgi:anti-sigma factor RsiW
MSIFTPEDLIAYLYHETSPAQTASIKEALTNDWALQQKFKVIESSVQQLSGRLHSPRAEAVLNVLDYARRTMPVSSE